MGEEHPEQPARLHSINDQIISSGLESVLRFADANMISKETLKLAHSDDYVDSVISNAPQGKNETLQLDPDTLMMNKSLDAALYAAGSVVDAVDSVLHSEVQRAFCSVRPPGHHASANASSGFCIFNNIAVGAKYALEKYAFDRIAIVDFDVHHGDGTQNIFADDERVLFCSSFQHPFFPHSGDEQAREGINNVPLPAGTTGDEFRLKVSHWFDLIDQFKPQLLFLSAGFDAHIEDELGQMRLKENDFVWITNELKVLANRHCDGKIISVLEGGYALNALGRSVAAHIKCLAD